MDTDNKEATELEGGFTEVQVEMTEELYQRALAAAQEHGCTLDEWVGKILREETKRLAKEASETPEILTTDECVDVAAAPQMDDGREVEK